MEYIITPRRTDRSFALTAIAAVVAGSFAVNFAYAQAPEAESEAEAPAEEAPSAAVAEQGAAVSPEATPDDGIETIFVTGSAVRRIKGETALPVQTLDQELIKKSGATSVVDLLQKLPTMQGATMEAASIGGNTFGFAGVAIHNVGENRTLVLLNGRRLAKFGGQTLTGFAAAMDLNSIPISAIERVEILTDGASSLYGSDAVAGVVNFITKKKTTEGDATVSYYGPEDGAKEKGISISKGIGDYDKDGYNLFVTLAADKRTELKAVDRKFAESAIVNFNYAGQRWTFFNGSPRSIPANAIANGGIYAGEENNALVSPYLLVNGSCPAQHAQVDQACYYDHVTQIQIYPERERRTANASFSLKLNESNRFFTDVLYAKSEQLSKVAPVPGEIPVPLGSDLFSNYLAGLTDENGDAIFVEDTVASYRVFDLGPRISKDKTYFYQVSAGFEGTIAEWDYNFALTQSESEAKGYIGGYPGALAFSDLLSSGLIDPFVGPGQQSEEGLAALQSINYNGYWDGGISKLQTAEARASHALFDLPNGNPVMFAAGVSYFVEKFQSKPSEFAQANLDDPVAGTPAAGGPGTGDQRFGDAAAVIPYSADRKSWGAFAELVSQVTSWLELTGSVRHDDYDDVGTTTNYKGSFKLTPIREVLIRGSYGTGFLAPTVPQLNAALQSYGVTDATYDCSDALRAIASDLGAVCRPNGTQYDVFAGGNQDLKPEKSRQATIGFVVEPLRDFSFGADYWWVAIKDVFGQVAQAEAFANPDRYPGAWTTFTDIATGTNYIAYNQTNINTGKLYANGIDFNTQARWPTQAGTLGLQLIATYMLNNKEQTQAGGEYDEDIGDYSEELDRVAFRWQGRLITSLEQEQWSHSVSVNYKSGYKDITTTVDGIEEDGSFNGEVMDVTLKAKDYYTVDWQSSWNIIKPLTVTVGALNLFDRDPPRSLTAANFPVGYDARYFDPRGRTLFGKISFKF